MAKFLVSWTVRLNGTAQQNHEDGKALLATYAKWAPPADQTFNEFLTRMDGQGGYAVVSTDNVNGLASTIAPFATWLDYEIVPVLDIADGVAVVVAGSEFREAV